MNFAGMARYLYFDIEGASEYADVDRHTIYNWFRRGVKVDGERIYLPVRIVDGHTQISKIDIDNYLEDLGYEPAEEAEENDERTA